MKMRRALVAVVAVLLVAPAAAVQASDGAHGAPGAPKIIGPADRAVFGQFDEQVFNVSAVDPDRDHVTATISVVDVATGVSLSFSSNETASDDGKAPVEMATARPPVELPDGVYQWTATAVDSKGNAGPASAVRTLTVKNSATGGLGVNASDQCRQGRPAPVDGIVNGVFLRVRERLVGSERWVCVRTDDFGGRVVLRNVDGGPTAGTTSDANAAACGTATDNIAPGPHPVAVGEDGSFIDVYQGAGGVWLCVQAGPVSTRLLWAAPRTVGATSISYTPDTTGWRRPKPTVNSYPASGRCQAAATNLITVVNADFADGHLWIEAQQDSPLVTRVCFRTTNAEWTSGTVTGVRGAVLTVDGPAAMPTVAPVWDGCNQKLPTFRDPRLGSIGYTSEGTHGHVGVCWRSSLIGEVSVMAVYDPRRPAVLVELD